MHTTSCSCDLSGNGINREREHPNLCGCIARESAEHESPSVGRLGAQIDTAPDSESEKYLGNLTALVHAHIQIFGDDEADKAARLAIFNTSLEDAKHEAKAVREREDTARKQAERQAFWVAFEGTIREMRTHREEKGHAMALNATCQECYDLQSQVAVLRKELPKYA